MTRRSLFGLAASAVAAPARPVRLGGPVFLKTDDPVELAREHKRLGYSAAYCPNVDLSDTPRLRAVEDAFRVQNVAIAEVGAWVNLLESDSEKRKKNLQYAEDRLAVAEAVGALCCVDVAGSFNPTVWYGPHPRNVTQEYFDATVENCRRLIDAVKPKRTYFTIEMSPWNLPDSPDEYLRLIRAVGRSAFGVHLDPCNIVNSPRRMYANAGLIRECFQKLGRWILSCHAKDLRWVYGMQMQFEEVAPGRGEIDFGTYLRQVSQSPLQAPLMLEHLKTPEEYDEGARHVRSVAASLGLAVA